MDKLNELRKQLYDFKAHIEKELPNPHENLEDVNVAYLKGRLDTIENVLLMVNLLDR